MSEMIQKSDAWLSKRRTMIGASDAPIIMGVSPWHTQYTLWQEKLQLIPEKKKKPHMQEGLDIEDKARESFRKETGIAVFPEVVFHGENNFMMASLDGLSPDRKTGVEIKHPGIEDHMIAVGGQVPEKYFPQLQHQMEVLQMDEWYYYSWLSKTQTALVKVKRDDKYIKSMMEKEKEFINCLRNFIAPKLTSRDYETKDDQFWETTAREWMDISNQIKTLEIREKFLRESLISQSNESNSVGSGVKLTKIVRKGSINYQSVPELKGLDLEEYRLSPVSYWRVTSD